MYRHTHILHRHFCIYGFFTIEKEKPNQTSQSHLIPPPYCCAMYRYFLSQPDFCIFRLCVLIPSLSSIYSRLGVLVPCSPPSPNHSSESALIRSTTTSLSSNSGHCSDLTLLHNSAVFLNAINHSQFLATPPGFPSCPFSAYFVHTSFTQR